MVGNIARVVGNIARLIRNIARVIGNKARMYHLDVFPIPLGCVHYHPLATFLTTPGCVPYED